MINSERMAFSVIIVQYVLKQPQKVFKSQSLALLLYIKNKQVFQKQIHFRNASIQLKKYLTVLLSNSFPILDITISNS